LPEYETIVKTIMDLKDPTANPKGGRYMEAMDLLVRGIEGDLDKLGIVLWGVVSGTREQRDIVQQRVKIISIILGIVAVLAGSIFSYHIIKSVIGPIGDLLAVTRKITEGDFTARAKIERDDEIGELARHFNRMVEELVISREHISAIFQGSGDSMRVIDKDFNILQANMEMEKLTGIPCGESIGKKCYEELHHEFCRTENCTLRRVLAGDDRIE